MFTMWLSVPVVSTKNSKFIPKSGNDFSAYHITKGPETGF